MRANYALNTLFGIDARQLTDGWSKPPAGSPGIGGLAPLAGSVLSATVNSNTTSQSRSAPPLVAAPIAQIQSHESPIDNIVGGRQTSR
ncbi:hypothetical protein L5L78_09685 [Shewanella sp. SM34]|uniref:hypothetical protein n=1 Tax=unclassified Shewanella TaxID=196818 RepID=UPI0021DAEA66|nr:MULTISPECIES: hypothetical protein [unclassified Shewanella]MCU8056475.1 hypothetical protein [Shewanella sp. SM35]MCU8065409.1 hypothetical protein [Shewanella sp. SM34]